MAFTTYENRAKPHVSIHRDTCSQLRKHGGIHKDGQEHYKEYSTYKEAKTYAVGTKLPLLNCSFCNPQ